MEKLSQVTRQRLEGTSGNMAKYLSSAVSTMGIETQLRWTNLGKRDLAFASSMFGTFRTTLLFKATILLEQEPFAGTSRRQVQ